MAGEEQTTKPARGDHGEIERPDAKYPPHVKRWNVDGTGVPLFPQQELGNEVRAKKEKKMETPNSPMRAIAPAWVGLLISDTRP